MTLNIKTFPWCILNLQIKTDKKYIRDKIKLYLKVLLEENFGDDKTSAPERKLK